jgi:diguanylate cyclase (GGDEF)-like protein
MNSPFINLPGPIYPDFRGLVRRKYLEDYATALYNKNFFIKNMEFIALQMIKGKIENAKNKSDEKTWSIIFCDIDGLKLANDTLGHVEADVGIKNIAGIIKDCIRTKRRENDSLIYPELDQEDNIPIRFGGDEFLIILPNCTKEKAILIQKRIKKQINSDKNHTRNMSLSMGIADTKEIVVPSDIDNPETIKAFVNDLISLAEKRMYSDKNKQVKHLSYEEQKLIVTKYLNRVGEQVGFNFQNPNELEALINILVDIKQSLKTSKKKNDEDKENRTK